MKIKILFRQGIKTKGKNTKKKGNLHIFQVLPFTLQLLLFALQTFHPPFIY